MKPDKREVTNKVKEFYQKIPFNLRRLPEDNVNLIKGKNQVIFYPDFHNILTASKNGRLLDVGCGVGWFTNSIGYYYPIEAYGIDISYNALRRASEVSKRLDMEQKVTFFNCDLFHSCFKIKFKFVNSLGVLHHTFDLSEALAAVSRYVETEGYLHIGLYHKFGRTPFLEIFKNVREKISRGIQPEEDEMNEAYLSFKRLNPNMSDEIFLQSWFRDQVLHPHETQHTLQEVVEILKPLNFDVISTSINKFAPLSDISAIFGDEKRYYEISRKKNLDSGTYFPGFFTVLAKRRG